MHASEGRGPPTRSALRSAWAVIVLAAAQGCLADLSIVSTPNYGFIRITVVATGGDFDADGYILTLGVGQT